jgi:hypothetical protein
MRERERDIVKYKHDSIQKVENYPFYAFTVFNIFRNCGTVSSVLYEGVVKGCIVSNGQLLKIHFREVIFSGNFNRLFTYSTKHEFTLISIRSTC